MAFALVAGFGVALASGIDGIQNEQKVGYAGEVSVYHNGELVSSHENALMEGKEIVAEQVALDGTTDDAFTTIALTDDDTETYQESDTLEGEVTDCGLEPTEASDITVNDKDGEWVLEETFVNAGGDGCDPITIYGSASKSTGGTSSYTYFAGADFDRTDGVTLYPDDELTVIWEKTAQSA